MNSSLFGCSPPLLNVGMPFWAGSFVVEHMSGDGRVGRVEGTFEAAGLVIGAQTELITETFVLRERGVVGCRVDGGVEATSGRPVGGGGGGGGGGGRGGEAHSEGF